MVARALISDITENLAVYNPEEVPSGSAITGLQILAVEAGALSDDLTDATSYITVTVVTGVR